MRVLIVGATGALGQDVVAATLARGHDAVALVRGDCSGLPTPVETVQGDILKASSLHPALTRADTVICVLGTPSPRQGSTLLRNGTQNLVAAMQEKGIRRLVCVTLLGAGRSRSNASLFYREVVLRVLAPMMPDKEAQEHVIRDSGLDWTLVRPPRFVGGQPRGHLKVIEEGGQGRLGHVVRSDLAEFLMDCATQNQYVRRAVAVGS